MGFNSLVLLHNDTIHEIDKDPAGWWKSAWGSLNDLEWDRERHVQQPVHIHHRGGGQAVSNQHADVVTLVAVGGNFATIFWQGNTGGSHHLEGDRVKILREAAAVLGYDLHRKPKKRKKR